MKKSEFGDGLVYNLVLFSQHFNNRLAEQIGQVKFLMDMSEEKRKRVVSPNPPAEDNYGKEFEYAIFWWQKLRSIYPTVEEAFSEQITTWANGASDHLYGLKIPKQLRGTKLAKKIKLLRDTGLDMGHGFLHNKIWTYEDFRFLKVLTDEIAMELDLMIGVKPKEAEYS